MRKDRVVAGTRSTADGLEAQVAVPVPRETPYALSMRRPLSTLASATAVVDRGFEFAAAVTLAIAILVGAWAAARLVRRLNALRDDVLRVADDAGPATAVAPDETRDEVGDLARAFAAMQRRVAEQEQARRTFVATASHELRTPLASLRLMLGLLAEDLREQDPDLDDARGQVERATAQSDRLARLAADLLDLSRLDAVVGLREEPVEVAGLARAVIAEFDGVALDAGDEPHTWALADPGAVARILRILLDNARRFAPRGDARRRRMSNGGARCEIAVQDEGPASRRRTTNASSSASSAAAPRATTAASASGWRSRASSRSGCAATCGSTRVRRGRDSCSSCRQRVQQPSPRQPRPPRDVAADGARAQATAGPQRPPRQPAVISR